MTDVDPERTAAVMRQAVANLEALTRAKKAAMTQLHPRVPVQLTPEQLTETWRRSGIRDPRRSFAPNVVHIAPRRSQATGD